MHSEPVDQSYRSVPRAAARTACRGAPSRPSSAQGTERGDGARLWALWCSLFSRSASLSQCPCARSGAGAGGGMGRLLGAMVRTRAEREESRERRAREKQGALSRPEKLQGVARALFGVVGACCARAESPQGLVCVCGRCVVVCARYLSVKSRKTCVRAHAREGGGEGAEEWEASPQRPPVGAPPTGPEHRPPPHLTSPSSSLPRGRGFLFFSRGSRFVIYHASATRAPSVRCPPPPPSSPLPSPSRHRCPSSPLTVATSANATSTLGDK